jgi:RNA-directed DNA polymerase
VQRFKGKVKDLLDVRNKSPRQDVLKRLNQLLIGWSGYFSYGTRLQAYRAVDHHVYDRVRHFLRKRHKVQTRATRVFSREIVYGDLGVVRLRRVHLEPQP